MNPKAKSAPKSNTPESLIYQLKITLQESNPPIWRTVEVPAHFTLEYLHWIIQEAMGWEMEHLWQFLVGKVYYSDPRYWGNEPFGSDKPNDARKIKIQAVLPKEKKRIFYEYDLGDGWLHEIVLEKILPPEPKKQYPRCVGGERACPPEDCGGIYGYHEMLEVLNDPQNPEHENIKEWLGEFDPNEFSAPYVNVRLRRLMTRIRVNTPSSLLPADEESM